MLLKRNDAEPSGYTVKVGDFGLSVMLPQHVSHLSNMRMGTMVRHCDRLVCPFCLLCRVSSADDQAGVRDAVVAPGSQVGVPNGR